jgi:peroxiredoxin
MKQIFTLLIACAIVFTGVAQNVGETAPDFTLKTLINQDYKLSDNRGNVILVFLVGHSCPLCIASAPTVKSAIIDAFSSNSNFQTVVIDTWNGSTSAFQNFKNSTGLPGVFLQNGQSVATNWSTTYDRLVVIDSEGVMTFKGSSAASSDANSAKQAVQTALNNIVTSLNEIDVDGFRVEQNYPNPFSHKSRIEFNLPKAETVSFRITDITGKVSLQINRFYPAGNNSIEIDGSELPKGIYFYRLDAGERTRTGKMIRE